MALQIIVVGDLTSHGGRVISGSETHTIGGKRIARLFDLVDCPQKYPDGRPHGINKIIEAHPTFTIGDERVAVAGNRTECGCELIGSTTASIGD
ncbi:MULTISPECIES: PAAR domain-containing protein [Paraburkholderia]|uniref:Zn-binding Pro-Ala-Ala-Arg (PAAR) domain-containing protein, incolved in TypeVI secretion n=1 Tax=Paraburkholderia terricola TaxID=169427 RepID=A0A1M6WDD5_9BURK|nr:MULTISPECIES: PAAR domain-containing protein [Paraburkholderia]SDP17970.1 Zn-binding Pro-Ala-Ala-Arg (PAAR) domain-containing protein, incolved in TypeVI secretion [Paraburkholderia sediminicola]SHK91586.1 Zn-binding Pro-Ala-Ala-Arg (PAAR) domain-containing protein, incolved in TypeVI secretion [Paraburkholderia terricola]